MDGPNADSDHSMTWEDFFGSTTDLTPTLIGIYDSLLEPKSTPEVSRFNLTAKDSRNDPPEVKKTEEIKMVVDNDLTLKECKVNVQPPVAIMNKSSLYSLRTNGESGKNGALDSGCEDKPAVNRLIDRTIKTETKVSESSNSFDNLSPNVKRMLSSADTTSTLRFQRKPTQTRSSGRGYRSNIPLVGTTSKIAQAREVSPTVDIYDQPSSKILKAKSEEPKSPQESPSKVPKLKPEFKLDIQETYDVPTNNRPAIYDVPLKNKTAFETLSLPYIDQSIELSISCDDREFDTKISSKDNTPEKPVRSPIKHQQTNGCTNGLSQQYGVPAKLAKTESFTDAVGSVGDIKCTLDRERPRMNPPTVEVSRPLSMSSLASSSSTSSSGVQNKGVNSAYLASIESLDDQSDMDLTSANRTNNFVNAGMKSSSQEERRTDSLNPQRADEGSGLSQLQRVCAEIVHTENVYVQDLQQVVEGYLQEWRRLNTFSEDELNDLFNNIEDIYTFNRSLCDELNSCQLDATCIARCFVKNTSGFSVYTSYCTGYPRTMERLAALASNSESAREFRERQGALGHPLPLASYLLKPVQRILKYHLLLQNLVKQCASQDTEYALLQMTGIAQHIDDMKRKHEHAVRVQEIQSLLYGWNGPDLTTYGELCAEGTFRVFGAKAMRHIFLFDKMLLVTKNREDGILAYKQHIMCNNLMLVESISGAALSFHVIPWDAPRAQLTLQARSQRHKREWTLLLKRVILENYNAVIPSHARQLVMELGQNKTDDDMLAEKSNKLKTQASMRKQLSAPEYLEKRKLERERRKPLENGIRGRFKKNTRKYPAPVPRPATQECDCAEVSLEKGIDYTCENCYIDLCSDCEEITKDKCDCKNDTTDKCAECDRSLHFIDADSTDNIAKKSDCKCSDFKSSQESFVKEFPINKTREYHSSDNLAAYKETTKELNDTNNSMTNVRSFTKTCLKCSKIKENIVVTEVNKSLHPRRSRCQDIEKTKADTLRSKSKEDSHRTKLSKIGTWRRKSEPGLQQNIAGTLAKKQLEGESEKPEVKGCEKIEFECRNCGSNKINKKSKNGTANSDNEFDRKREMSKSIEIKQYNSKNIPKKISKLKKNRAKSLRTGGDARAKFYADFSTDVSTENILHISESNDSLNIDKDKSIEHLQKSTNSGTVIKDDDIDEETYKKLIEKTDSFKKNELEKGKYLNKQNVINEGLEVEDEEIENQDVAESEVEQPLEQIISQLLMQNREFQKILKKQQQRSSAQRRQQRLLKSYSNPEQPIVSNGNKTKPTFSRQTSETYSKVDNDNDIKPLSPPQELADASDDDHIYETLRIENKIESVSSDRVIPIIPAKTQNHTNGTVKKPTLESDYVYLSFDKLNKLHEIEGIYDVPVKSPEKVPPVRNNQSDYYVTIEKKEPIINSKNDVEELYDSIIEVCRRKKEDTSNEIQNEYLPMNADQQSPVTPEIWLSRQKEHFNVSRDRKSGSLPRSFQVVVPNEENNLSTFKSKPNTNKTYLNRDGKVVSTDRPFTIASDQSEISFDDVENYRSEKDILKFSKISNKLDGEITQDISQSTLELEEEIDRCYKNNFEVVALDGHKNENLLNVSQPNLNVSTSSCEFPRSEDRIKEVDIVHPEHKIYKPTSNILSLKNVLNRFKSRKSTDDLEVNNDTSSPDSAKSDPKSPLPEKKSALNPRSYSKNLLQRFRSIIGDEQPEENSKRQEALQKQKKLEETQKVGLKSDIKVVITSTDVLNTSTLTDSYTNDGLSRSVFEPYTTTMSQSEKNNLEPLSHSCDNISKKPEDFKPNYEKSVSMITNIPSSGNTPLSPSKSINFSQQSVNKLPVYMQGSKKLGARIAQSDYVDPTTLVQKSGTQNINILINKNAVRPDSLFSNSSFVTSSSEGTYQENQTKPANNYNSNGAKTTKDNIISHNSDESYYEKTFEKIEHVTDDGVFSDSAICSDQDEGDDNKTVKTVTQTESIKRNSVEVQEVKISSGVREIKSSFQTRLIVTSKVQNTAKIASPNLQKVNTNEITKPKVAPPVPAKPKLTSIPTPSSVQTRNAFSNNKVTTKSLDIQNTSSENTNSNTIKKNISLKQNYLKSEPLPNTVNNRFLKKSLSNTEAKTQEMPVNKNELKETTITDNEPIPSQLKPSNNIHIKRLSFERASLDSAIRKTRIVNETKRSSIDEPKTSKSVLERRNEIESLTLAKQPVISKKPSQLAKPRSMTTKIAPSELNPTESSEIKTNVKVNKEYSLITSKENNSTDQIKSEIDENKGSWVKTVVNKFQ